MTDSNPYHWVSPVASGQFRTHQTSLWTDLFWFHRTLDRLDPTDSKAVAAVLLAFFFLATAVAECRSYRTPEVVAATYETYLGVGSDE